MTTNNTSAPAIQIQYFEAPAYDNYRAFEKGYDSSFLTESIWGKKQMLTISELIAKQPDHELFDHSVYGYDLHITFVAETEKAAKVKIHDKYKDKIEITWIPKAAIYNKKGEFKIVHFWLGQKAKRTQKY